MAFLELRNVSKSYGRGDNRTEVLKNINLLLEEGEFLAIVGFSGSGKTTLISLIAGLIEPDEGEILVNGKKVTGPGPDRGVIFQSYSLLPWLTVYGNVALAVNQVFGDWSSEQRKAHVEKYVDMVGLTPALEKRPAELSGGMRQRVAVARALAMNPEMLLMDEPLSALDALTRGTLQREVENIWARDKKTAVLITNDVDEGLLLADRIIPLTPGPGATLGPVFEVPMARPREKTQINNDISYKLIRNAITNYLLNLKKDRNEIAQKKDLILPDLQPVDLRAAS